MSKPVSRGLKSAHTLAARASRANYQDLAMYREALERGRLVGTESVYTTMRHFQLLHRANSERARSLLMRMLDT